MDQTAYFPDYQFPDLTAYHKILFLGLGGGCDVISAYILSQHLVLNPTATVVISDCKDCNPQKVEDGEGPVASLPGYDGKKYLKLYPNEAPLSPKEVPKELHALRLGLVLPKGDLGSPWVAVLRTGEEDILLEELKSVGFDLVISVDAGGDSMVDEAASGLHGRDKRMLQLLQKSQIPLIHIVLGFGSDGESTEPEIQKLLDETTKDGTFKGCFPLEPLVPLIRKHCSGLGNNRTPLIIMNAIEGKKLNKRGGGKVVVGRGKNPVLPLEWLKLGFVFIFPTNPL